MRRTIVVDVHERRSRMDLELRQQGVNVVVRPLPFGDYEIGPVLVERKRVRDLHLSIIGRRFWPQLGRLRDATYFPYLLVEGADIDAGPLRADSVRGALLATDELGVAVIRSASASDSAFWLSVLAARMERRRNAPRRQPRRPPQRVRGPAEVLAGVPGISTGLASALLAEFGSVAELIAAGRDAWLRVQGIGPHRADSLERALCTERNLSLARSARPDPST